LHISQIIIFAFYL